MAGMASLCLQAAAETLPPKPVVIYYDEDPARPFNYGKLYANALYNMLGHFNVSIDRKDVELYVSGDLANYLAAFYIGSRYRPQLTDTQGIHAAHLPDTFLADVALFTSSGATRVVWINYNIWELLERPDVSHLGVLYTNWVNGIHLTGYNRVSYKDDVLFKGTFNFGMVEIQTNPPAQVLAWAYPSNLSANAVLPYCIRASNFWYIADNCFDDDVDISRTLVLADQLHDILGSRTATNHRFLVRLEDVNPGYSSPTVIDSFSTTLQGRGIRASLAVISHYKDPTGSNQPPDIRMSQSATFVQALSNAVNRGHYLLCHGYTHNNDEEPLPSADGYEFWYHGTNGYPGRPLAVDGWDYANERMTSAVAEFARCGLPMHIWETPHYEASLVSYLAIAQRFPYWYERMRPYNIFTEGMSSNDIEAVSGNTNQILEFQTQYLPYTTYRSVYGSVVLPENLNFYQPAEDPFYDAYGRLMLVTNKLMYARQLRVVRDAVGSFYFHLDYNITNLIQLLDGMTNLGYTVTHADALLEETPVEVGIFPHHRFLKVISAYGGASPRTFFTNVNTDLDCYVTNSPVLVGVDSTQHVCVGATVLSNAFTQVSPTNVTLTLTNNATLHWQWSTNYWLKVETNGSGTLNVEDGWRAEGGSITITGTPAAGWRLADWSGDTNDCAIHGNVITAPMTYPRRMTALFVANEYLLAVVSEHGGALPGTLTTTPEVPVDAYVTNSPLLVGVDSTQHVCVGATVLSNAFTQVSPTNVTLTLTNNATLTWQWKRFPGPAWWYRRQVVDTGSAANDYAACNQGQVKWMARQAYLEMEARLPGGAGVAVSNLVAGFTASNNYRAVNLGQVKAVARPFYDRLGALRGQTNYPWTGAVSTNDFAAANIGQVKNVFSFSIGE